MADQLRLNDACGAKVECLLLVDGHQTGADLRLHAAFVNCQGAVSRTGAELHMRGRCECQAAMRRADQKGIRVSIRKAGIHGAVEHIDTGNGAARSIAGEF